MPTSLTGLNCKPNNSASVYMAINAENILCMWFFAPQKHHHTQSLCTRCPYWQRCTWKNAGCCLTFRTKDGRRLSVPWGSSTHVWLPNTICLNPIDFLASGSSTQWEKPSMRSLTQYPPWFNHVHHMLNGREATRQVCHEGIYTRECGVH